jgi:hypothetical protein
VCIAPIRGQCVGFIDLEGIFVWASKQVAIVIKVPDGDAGHHGIVNIAKTLVQPLGLD